MHPDHFNRDLSSMTTDELDMLLIENDIYYLSLLQRIDLRTDESGTIWIVGIDQTFSESWDLWA